jgi:hypothetical protein
MSGDGGMNGIAPRKDRGLTLIEILLALIVMVLGIVGILALFPPALESAKESMENTQAAIAGESVANALSVAVRFATYDPATNTWLATLTHDLQGSGMSVRYTFPLPQFSNTAMDGSRTGTFPQHHPPGVPAVENIEGQQAFGLGSDPWTSARLAEVRKSDPSDPLSQFAFSFRVRKIHTLAFLEGKLKNDGTPWTLQDLDPLSKLYEFQITVFRFAGSAEEGLGAKDQPKRAIATMTTRVSTK